MWNWVAFAYIFPQCPLLYQVDIEGNVCKSNPNVDLTNMLTVEKYDLASNQRQVNLWDQKSLSLA